MNGLGKCLLWLGTVFLAATAQAQTTVEYIHTDALGSVVAVTNAAGQVIERNDYEPYGAIIGKPSYGGVGFTGHVQDAATGLTYMQQRYYDPQFGRFLSVDPITADGATGNNFNRYWYANNNPYTNIDPDGRICDNPNASSACNGGAVTMPSLSELRPAAELALDFTPIVGDAKGIVEAYQDPSVASISAAVVGFVPLVGDAGAKTIRLSVKAQGEAALHAKDAIAAGKPSVLTIARDGADANRAASTGGIPKVPGKQLDEYPPAMFREGGSGASVRAINPSDNMSAGACIGNACRGLPDGAKVRIVVED